MLGDIIMLIYAIISITSALILYTFAIWSEKIQGKLKKWHLFTIYLGLISDILGTTLMSKMAKGGFQLNFHGITGVLGITLMLFQAVWGTIVLIKNDEKAKTDFHKFSIWVWIIWLIPYISGAFLGMAK